MKKVILTALIWLFFANFNSLCCPSQCYPPGVPTLTAPTNGSCVTAPNITLNWNPVSLGDRYYIYIDEYVAGVQPTTERGYVQNVTEYNWEGAEIGKKYSWRIKAVHICSTMSKYEYSSTWTFTTFPGQATGPIPADGQSDVSTSLTLQWTAGAGAADHDVYLGTNQSAVQSATIGSPEYKERISQNQYGPVQLTNGTTYYWRVDEINGTCIKNGQVWSFTTLTDTTAPANPTGLVATALEEFIQLGWNSNTEPDIDGYNIYRSENSGGGYVKINTSVVSDPIYIDNNVTVDTTYYYVVTAVDNSNNESGNSNEASATLSDTTAPAAPTGFTATAGEGYVNLNWNDNSEPDLSGYNLYRSIAPDSEYIKINPVLLSSSYYQDSSVVNDTLYHYVVTAVDDNSNESELSLQVSAMPLDLPPAAPLNLSAVFNASTGSIDLSWDNNTEPDLGGYKIYKSLTANGPYVELATVTESVNHYNDAELGVSFKINRTYYYVVTAFDDPGANESAYSESSSVTFNYRVRNLNRNKWYYFIQNAVDDASSNETIMASQGTYFENIHIENKKITLVSENPTEPASTIIDGSGLGTVMTFDSGTSNSRVHGFKITNGFVHGSGGGVYCTDSVTFESCIFTGNFGAGSAAYVVQGGSLEFIDCEFSNNNGSAVYGESNNFISLRNCTFVYNYDGCVTSLLGTLEVYDSHFMGNSGPNNAGIYSTGDLLVERSIFYNNNCSYQLSKGGAITVAGESAKALIKNSVFTNNSTQYGGAIQCASSVAGGMDVTIKNCTITNNQARLIKELGGKGGGIYFDLVEPVTISPVITNCIIWGNSNQYGSETEQAQIYSTAGSPTITYSCITAYSGSGSNGNISNDPLLNTDNFYLLETGSPCIDAGDPEYVPVFNEKDITGNRRLRATAIDIGAYEYGTVIYVDSSQNGSEQDGESWNTAFKYLQDGLANAEAGDEIWVAAGTYYPDERLTNPNGTNERSETFQMLEKVAIYGGFAGGETSLNQRNLQNNKTILSGDIDQDDNGPIPDNGNCYHVVTGASNCLIDGFIITGGVCSGADGLLGGGGMLNNEVENVQVINCTFNYNNTGTNAAKTINYNGGAMFNRNSSVLLTNCLFSDNSTAAFISFSESTTALNLSYGNGGAVYSENSNISLINCTVSNNLAGFGGGIYVHSGNLSADNSIIWDNSNKGVINRQSQVYVNSGANAILNYCCINEGWNGSGSNNKNEDPLFILPGRWEGTATPGSVTVEATIRDFKKGWNNTEPISDGHPDFEKPSTTSICSYPRYKTGLDEGLVQNELDDEFKPVYDPNGDDNCNIKNSESFRQWYRDTEGVNLSKQIELVLTYDPSSNTYVFSDNEFFPIDGELWDNQNLSPNYHFTLELQTAFEYVEPSAESRDFKIFKSDDDLWVFIERHDDRKPVLVLDLGGLHTGRCAYFRFENGNAYITRYYDTSSCEPLPGETEVPLGLQEGEIYNLYLFFAERHTIHSNLHFWTTLKLDTQCIPGDYRLQAGSPCIDAGDNTAVPIGITTDIDGLSRFVDDPDTPDTGNRDAGDSRAYVDIGAYEFQSNLPPIAAAGENQTHYVCGSDEWVYITLDGSGSTDPDSGNPPDDDDDIVSYIWSWIENSEEITVEGKIVEVTMTAQYSPYTVTLTVTDSSGSSDTDTMQIFINSSANPIADIGSSPMTVIDGGPQDSDGSVNGRAEVTLDASGSSGANLIYMWQYKGQIIAQGYEDTAKTITTRFGIGTHNIILYVIDQCGNWDFAEMQVIVQWPPPSSPSIDAGPNQEFNLPLPDDVVISLKGEVVFDPAGQIANFLWKLVDKPAGGYAVLDSSMSLETDIIEISEDIHGEYRFMLYGLDSDYNEVAKDSTSVILKSTTRSNQQPIVDAWIVSGSNKLKEQFVYENNITIKGNVSDDGQPKGNLTARWRQISGPLNGLTVTPLAESCSNRCKNLEITSEIMFAENGYGTYQLALYASDGILYGRDIIAVHYTSSLPPLVNAGGNKFAVMAGAYVDVKMDDAYVIDREYPFDDTVKEWTLIQGNAANIVFLDSQGLPNGDTSSDENPIIRFYANGQYQFQLKATEAGKAPVTDTVYVTISQEPVEIIDEWPMFHHNTARTGYSNSRAPNKKNILWIFETNQNVDHGDKVMTFSSPAVVGGVVYIGISYVGYGAPQNKGYLFAIDAFSGDLMWKFEADGGIRSSPAVDGDRVFFLTESGILYGVNIYTRNYWSDNIGKCDNCSAMQDPENPNETLGGAGWSWSSPVVNNGYVFVASSDGYIHRLEASTGDRKPDWDKKAINYFSDPPHPNGPVTVFNGKVICGTHSLEKTIVAFDENSGEEIWSVDKYRYNSGGVAVADVDGNGEFEIYFGTGYQPHDDTGYFFSINESSPYSQNWSKYTGGGINSTPAIYDGKIFVGTSRTVYGNKGEFLILDAANGNTLATFRPTEFPSQDANNMWSIWSSPAVADGKVFFGATDHILYVLSVDAEGTLDENDLLWFHHTGEDSRIWTSPAIAYGNVYVADENGTVFAFSERVVNFWMTDDIEDGDCAALGDTITYAINYSYPVEPDADQTALEDVRIISYLPDGIDRSSVLPSDSGFYDSVENVVVWQIGTLERGDTEGTVTVSMNISETAPQGLRLTNNASIRNNDILLSSAMVKTDVCCFAPGIIYVDKKAMGLNSGRSWKDACTDLQNALQKTAWNCGSEIWVADGIYFVPTYDPEQTFVIPDGVSIYGGFKGTEKTINERDIKSSSDLAGIETVLHGSYIHNYVVTAQGDSVINGFTIAGGFKAGVLCNNSAAKIVNCWIVDNGYENDGDAGVCITGTSTANILNCVLTDNYGHGIYISDTASPFIRNNTIVYNRGYGIINIGTGTSSIYNCIIGNGVDLEENGTTYYCYISGFSEVKDENNNFGGGSPFGDDGYHLASDSACIDQGHSADIHADETDIDGEPRIVGDAVDIGADEFPPIWVDAGKTIFAKIPIGSPSVTVEFKSASIKSSGGTNVPTNLAYQWSNLHVTGEPDLSTWSSTELYPSAIFNEVGWYLFELTVINLDTGKTVGKGRRWVRVDMEIDIIVSGKTPVNIIGDTVTYAAYVDEELSVSANPCTLQAVQWSAPVDIGTIESPESINTTATFNAPGRYPLILLAFNEDGKAIGYDIAWIEVQYQMVDISAGQDRTLYLEKNSSDIWEVSSHFIGAVAGIVPDRVEWSVEAASEDTCLDSVLIDNPTNTMTNITFGSDGAYFVLFSAWKNTPQGEMLLGTSAAVTVVKYKKVILYAGPDKSINISGTSAIDNLKGEIKAGSVDSVEWVFLNPDAPDGLVVFASPKSLDTMVTFNAVPPFSGVGTYTLTLLGKINISGEEVIVAAASVNIEVIGGGGGSQYRNIIEITVDTEPDPIPDPIPELPFTVKLTANITDVTNPEVPVVFSDYDYAVWSWGGTDNSVYISQPDISEPIADITFDKIGSYVLTLHIKNGEKDIGVITYDTALIEMACSIEAKAGFDETMEIKTDVRNVYETITLYGQVTNNCVHIPITSYWTCSSSSDALHIKPIYTGNSNEARAEVIFYESGGYPLTLCVMNAETQELEGFETIYIYVSPPQYSLNISGSRVVAPGDSLSLTATILGGAPEGSTCTWSAVDAGVALPEPATVVSGTPILVGFDSIGRYELIVTGNIVDPVWSQTCNVTVYVSEDETLVWDAGDNKIITLPATAYMSDALFVSNEPTIIPKWSFSGPDGALVMFFPNETVEKPYVSFSAPGQYTLSMIPWDVQEQAQVQGTLASTVVINVYSPSDFITDGSKPRIEFNITESGNLRILTVKAYDEQGVNWVQIEYDGEVIASISGAPIYPSGDVPLVLTHYIDVSNLSAGTHAYTAYAWNTAGNFDSVSQEITNNHAIYDFYVTPELLTNSTGNNVNFYASFIGAPAWTLSITKAGTNIWEITGTGDGLIETVNTGNWDDGSYTAKLTLNDEPDTFGNVNFQISRIGVNTYDITAELSYLSNEDNQDIQNFIRNLEFAHFTPSGSNPPSPDDLPIPIIKQGSRNVWAKIGYPDFPDEVEYLLQICKTGEGTDLIPVKLVTPGPHNGDGWSKISAGGNLENLGVIDLSTLDNGSYYLVLWVKCKNSEPQFDDKQFILDCPLKIGNLKFSQEDIVVETGGIPLRIVRTYDSFNKYKKGEFGYGWTNSIADMDIELDESRTTMYESTLLNSGYIDFESVRCGGEPANRNVTLTLPDGRRTTFMFYLKFHDWNLNNSEAPYYTAEYCAMDNIGATLRTLEKEIAAVDIIRNEISWMGITGDRISTNDPAMYDFSGYILTTEDGTQYVFERKLLSGSSIYGYSGSWYSYRDTDVVSYWTRVYGEPYLTKIITVDGEEIVFDRELNSPNGKISSIQYKDAQGNISSKSLQINYDEKGRIFNIIAPSEVGSGNPTLKYEYDSYDNLIKVSRLVSNDSGEYEHTYYEYEDNRYAPKDHYVTAIKDDRGLMPIRYVYDAAGRLIETIDAKGNRISIQHGGLVNEDGKDYKAEVVYERWDTNKEFPTIYAYNERGNVVLIQKCDASGTGAPVILEQTKYIYGSSIYPDGPSEIHKWLGGVDYAVTKYEYDKYGKNTLTVDPLGNAVILKYDIYGNILETIQAKNYVDTLDYDIVSVTKNGYSGSLLKHTEIQDADENVLDMTVNFYDGLKRLRNTAKIDVSVISNFDNVRNAQSVEALPEKAKHVVTAYHYTGNDLQPDWIEDAAGAGTYFAYDDNGRQKYSYYESQGIYIFNVNVYDSLGRILQSEQIIDDETPYSGDFERRLLSRTKYNTSGKVEYSISDSNNLTKYEYDIIGNVVETRTYNIADIAWDNHEAIIGYINNANNVLTISRTLYDTEGRAIVNVGPYAPNVYQQPMSDWPVAAETVYDVLGRAIETRRWAGVKIDLVPFKLSSSGEPIICSADDEGMLGKMTPPGVYTSNALTYSSTEPDNIGWTSNDKLPVAAQSIDSDEIGPLSYSRTIYDLAGGVLHSVSLDENGYEQLTSYEYDLAGRQTAVIDPLGHKIDNLYTAGIVLNNASITNAAKVNFNNFDYHDYDLIYRPNGNFTGTHRTVTHYDGSRRDYVVDAMGNTISFVYDSLGRVIRTNYPATTQNPQTYVHTKYDGLGRKSFESQQTAEINPDDAVGKTFEYDIAGRLIKVILPTVDDGTPEYRYFYDTFGNMVGILDPLNRITVFEYDALNRQTAKFMPFDFTDPTGGEITVYYIYESIPAEQKYQMSFYDDFGRIEYSADYKGQITSYEYDSRGRLSYKKYYINEADYTADEPNAAVEYAYDSLGRKEQVIDSRHGTTTYYYDAEGRIISVVSPEGTVNYSYNSITGQKVNTNSARTNTDYYYDELGRLQGTSTASEDVYYHYDDNGNRKWQCIDINGGFNNSDPENPSGYEIKTDYSYDSLNRLTDLIHKKADLTTLSGYSYTLKADGSRQSVNESLQEDRNITYGYDNLNRLLSETAVSGENGYNATYTYDLAGNRLTRHVEANGQILETEYEYYPGTDKLYKEIHTGPIAALDSGNERYYAYAGSGGKGFYYRDCRGNAVSSLKAYFIGLPVVWSRYVFMAVLILSIILFFLPNVIFRRSRRELGFFHRGMCVLLAWLMFISPEMFNQLSDASVDYEHLGTSSWGHADREITYAYDGNGSLIIKNTADMSAAGFPVETVYYTYDAANRLIKIRVTPSRTIKNFIEYTYNDDGIRVSEYSYTTNCNGPAENEKTVIYLTDSYNHTGYSQALEELTFNKANPDLQTDTPDSVRTYLIGDDCIAQRTDGDMQYLLYDGHGSTRQLARWISSDIAVDDSYSYDGYGVLLQDDNNFLPNGTLQPGKVGTQATSLLYAGEHFDFNAQQYYNRARWYNPLIGLFNQVDPYAGNLHDPQSLHKYLYCHANPVNAIDPSGMFAVGLISTVMSVGKSLALRGHEAGRYYMTFNKVSAVIDIVAISAIIASGIFCPEVAQTKAVWRFPLDKIVRRGPKLPHIEIGYYKNEKHEQLLQLRVSENASSFVNETYLNQSSNSLWRGRFTYNWTNPKDSSFSGGLNIVIVDDIVECFVAIRGMVGADPKITLGLGMRAKGPLRFSTVTTIQLVEFGKNGFEIIFGKGNTFE